MIKRKGKFLTFCFSLLPGAGHMYLGFMKQGLSLMTLFFGAIFITVYLNIGALGLFLPIIYFYSFFDVINKNALCDEDFYALEDKYLFDLDFHELKGLLQGRFRPVIAVILILIGVQMLLSNCYHLLLGILPGSIADGIYRTLMPFLNRVPQLITALFIIAVGIHLIKGKKKVWDLMTRRRITNENTKSWFYNPWCQPYDFNTLNKKQRKGIAFAVPFVLNFIKIINGRIHIWE